MRTVRLILFCTVMVSLSCQRRQASDLSAAHEDSVPNVVEADSVFHDQYELNVASGNWSIEYNDSIEKVYQDIVSLFPQYNDLFGQEKSAWEKYQESVREVASYGNHGSSKPMYIADVLNQGIKLREMSLHNLYLHAMNKPVSLSKTKYSSTMIGDAYESFINSTNMYDEFDSKELEAYKKSIRKEQKLWNMWMETRKVVSGKLSDDIRIIYDDCTNMTMRTKLIQLKNQNRALGITGDDILNCVLPDSCSDKVLLEYPGFDKVWEKYLKGLN